MVSRKAFAESNWSETSENWCKLGHQGQLHLKIPARLLLARKHAHTHPSPSPTLGNISSWVAHDLMLKGPDISHSITCSTALHALLNGVVLIQSGMTKKFIVGGSEALLT